MDERDEIIRQGYAAERARGMQWSAPLEQRLSVQHYDHQRDFVKQAAAAFFQSRLFKENIERLPIVPG
jgi:hypothetical protein